MAEYYVNRHAQWNGDHEVHTAECAFLPDVNARLYLGVFTTCFPALHEARKHYHQSNGCHHCSPPCRTS